jgi:hypothetical protein
MTLILSLATPWYVIQVADRRLVWSDTWRIADDAANKVVQFCNQMAFSYTGLAELGGRKTDVWLTEQLVTLSSKDPDVVLKHIADRATEAVRKIPYPTRKKFHAFVGIGWTTEPSKPCRPLICEVTNFRSPDPEAKMLTEAQDRFVVCQSEFPADSAGVLATGAELSAAASNHIKRLTRACGDRQLANPATYLRIMVETIRLAADGNRKVGKDLLAVFLPRETAASGPMVSYQRHHDGHVFVGPAIPPDRLKDLQDAANAGSINVPACMYIPATNDPSSPVYHTPNMVCPGEGAIAGMTFAYGEAARVLRSANKRRRP